MAINKLIIENSSGNVGIGTVSPAATLDVGGTFVVSGGSSVPAGENGIYTTGDGMFIVQNKSQLDDLFLQSQGDITYQSNFDDGTINADHIFKTGSATEAMRIDGSSGNVGIGTTNPGGKLHVVGTDHYQYIVQDSVANIRLGADDSTMIGIAMHNTANLDIGTGDWFIGRHAPGTPGIIDAMNFARYNGSSWTQLFRITSSGDVGIGTTSPSTKLHVAGNSSTRNTIVSNLTLDGGTNVPNPYDGFGFGINFIGRDYGNAIRNYAHIYSVMQDQSSSAGGGDAGFKSLLSFYTNSGGASNTDPTEKMRITSAGNVGIGTTSPGAKLSVDGSAIFNESGADVDFRIEGDTDANLFFVDASTDRIGVGTNAPVSKLSYSGTFDAPTVASKPSLCGMGSYGGGIGFDDTNISGIYVDNAANNMRFFVGMTGSTSAQDSVKATLNSSGNLGLGVTPSAWGSAYKAFQVSPVAALASGSGGDAVFGNNWVNESGGNKYITSAAATAYSQFAGAHSWLTAPSGTAGNAITFTQAMTLDASNNLLLGTTSTTVWNGAAGTKFIVGGVNNTIASLQTSTTSVDQGAILEGLSSAVTSGSKALGSIAFLRENTSTTALSSYTAFYTNNAGTVAERARITSGGVLCVNTTSSQIVNEEKLVVNGVSTLYADSNYSLIVNRNTNDGDLALFTRQGATKGSISVSGETVSYNAFAGSHWSQLQDGSKPDILRGTVMESINELCEWPGEENERLPKAKISDTAGSKKVYGVFMAWDNDWTATNDMLVTAVGAFICRVNANVTVQEGDLLESNGDGTARVQADDIIRSSTIGKVTSTVKTHEYDDGSYCVPTVLYCG